MAVEGGHEVVRCGAARKHGEQAEYNGKYLTEVKAAPRAEAYIWSPFKMLDNSL